ncbi:MAG: CBS domain-containing protein [Oligoflexales bacterium]|nr:CBS domain-containing protein [Oligoflexales bacterium]
MIPQKMKNYLFERMRDPVWEKRLIRDGTKRYIELTNLDVGLLNELEIKVDLLGPRLVVAMWDEGDPKLEIGGYLVVDNMAMGTPSMGGIRMLPTVKPSTIHNLARGMTLKNAAAQLPYGGGKSGICVDGEKLSFEDRQRVIQGFGRLLGRYKDIYNPGPDVGTRDEDMKTIAIENGLDSVLSKPMDMGGNRIDELGAAARGVVLGLRAILKHMDKLKVIPQFRNLVLPSGRDISVIVQGFGAVGAHTARLIRELFPQDRQPALIGISDQGGSLYAPGGLPIDTLFGMWRDRKLVDNSVVRSFIKQMTDQNFWEGNYSFSSNCNELLREDAFCMIPAAPIPNYLGLDNSSNPSMTTDRMGSWRVIVEGANTYSPDPEKKLERNRLERLVYREKGILIVPDYLVNSGGVLYAAHELLIPTPTHLRFPDSIIGSREQVELWLKKNSEEFQKLSELRRISAEKKLEDVMETNMREFVALLAQDSMRLPWDAAQQISIGRISDQEKERTARHIMEPVEKISPDELVVNAAKVLLASPHDIIPVVSEKRGLEGVITDKDITRYVAMGLEKDKKVESIMTREVVTVGPDESILGCVRKLESFKISAIIVFDGREVLGLVSADLLAKKTLHGLLQTKQSH